MNISKAGLNLIKTAEGFRSAVYLDIAGLPTVGYGHRLTKGEAFPSGVTEAEAAAILLRDVAWAETGVNRCVRVPISQSQFDALVSFTYNVGTGTLANSTLLRRLNAGHPEDVPGQLLLFCHAGGRVSDGLTARRKAEARLWTEGE